MRALAAFFLRELHAALLNRLIISFSAIALFAGLAPLFADVAGDSSATAAWFLLQASLYLIPLVSLLIGASSAQSEAEEQPFLLSQPVSRGSRVAGKFLALWLVIALSALLLVAPSAVAGAPGLTFLWLHTLGIGGVFAALGLAVGFSTADRVKAHMIALAAWLLLLAGGDMLALALAQTGAMQRLPGLWLALLMFNPLDALRISGLLSLDRIPFDAAAASPLGRWWLTHLGQWFAMLSAAWIALALAWSRRQLERLEL